MVIYKIEFRHTNQRGLKDAGCGRRNKFQGTRRFSRQVNTKKYDWTNAANIMSSTIGNNITINGKQYEIIWKKVNIGQFV